MRVEKSAAELSFEKLGHGQVGDHPLGCECELCKDQLTPYAALMRKLAEESFG